jgi:hypothetical protein
MLHYRIGTGASTLIRRRDGRTIAPRGQSAA